MHCVLGMALCLGAALGVGCNDNGEASSLGEVEHSALSQGNAPKPVAPEVEPLKELMLVDPSIASDARALGEGAWSFAHLFGQMAPAGVDPSDFVLTWLKDFRLPELNGYELSDRFAMFDETVAAWAKRPDGKIDLAKAPFALQAIVNRLDLSAANGGLGELRFVFAGRDPDGFASPFTVILEYELTTLAPKRSAQYNRTLWAKKFHALATMRQGGQVVPRPFGEDFNAALQAITDLLVLRGANPKGINGSAIGQVRTNEIGQGTPWTMRQYMLQPNGTLRQVPVERTPDLLSFRKSQRLADILNSRRDDVLAEKPGIIPADMLAGESLELHNLSKWQPPGVPEDVRQKFAINTCNGCHNNETANLNGFYHVNPEPAPPDSDGTLNLSPFVLLEELPRRKAYFQHQLCGGMCNTEPTAEQPHPPHARHAVPSHRVH